MKINALWLALGSELAEMSDRYDVALATRKTEEATDAAWELARDEIPALKGILSPLQFSMAPGFIPYLASVKGRIGIRVYMY